ncbi:HAMP domain-containing histidine kinase [Listeria aquatica]|uniref:histidine kinase n=1 Tax=Listeria aquatica TaxID=1494960 RepID=A0A841ZK08_9LIST|nr:two component system sensor histidine kinase PieS [Listeria aquatica]MBC1521019.1 HAMP domain-containing histidine kinase [Listeria aquatica]
MKFKYVYQLFATQFIILLATCLLIGLLISNFLKDYLYESQVELLTKYGEKISSEIRFAGDEDMRTTSLEAYQHALDVDHIRYTILNNQEQIVFPTSDRPLPPDFKISKEASKNLKKGETVTIKVDNRFNQEMSVVYVPILSGKTFLGSVILNSPISGTEKVIGAINRYMFFTILLSVIIALVLSAILAKLQVNRINRLREATKRVISGDYETRLNENNWDEIGALSSDFNKMTETLATSKEEIERQEKRRRQFIADVSHEMRTPLTTISGLTEGLVNNVIPESETNRVIHLIDKESRRLTKLVNENLDYERIRANKIKLEKSRFSVQALSEVLVEQLEPLAQLKNDKLILDIETNLLVFADYDRLTQILLNILKNSIQFTENGTITLCGRSDYKETILEITDTGVGMDPEELEQIWDRFYKADLSRTNTSFGESGIGLSIVKQLVKAHDGSITVTSKQDQGTTFVIRLPNFSDLEEY